MSAPVIIDPSLPPLGLRNGAFDDENVRWLIPITSTAILYFAVQSSGNSNPYVRVRVSWGDGSVEETDLRAVGQAYNYIHQFSAIGTYNVLVEVFNSDFLPGGDLTAYQNSHASVTVPVWVEAVMQMNNSTSLNQWHGLALPDQPAQNTFNASNNPNVLNATTSLLDPATAGSRTIVVTTPEFAAVGAQLLLTEAGKLITSVRIISIDQTVITLDAGVSDNYTVAALVELRGQTGTQSAMAIPAANSDWFFPSSTTRELVRSELLMILSTRPTERVMLPEFGSGLHRVPFQQNDSQTATLVRHYTLEAIQTYAPRAEVVNFSITQTGNDLNIVLTAQVRGDDQTFPVTFSLLGQ